MLHDLLHLINFVCKNQREENVMRGKHGEPKQCRQKEGRNPLMRSKAQQILNSYQVSCKPECKLF